MNRGRWVRLGLGLALAALFLWLVFRQTDMRSIVATLAGAAPSWVALALLAFGAGYALRIERWRLMLATQNASVRWVDCAGPLMAGFAANNLLPFRAGDVLRAVAFNRTLGVSTGTVVASLLAERVLDLVMVLAFAVAASLLASRGWSPGLGVAAVLLGLAVAFIVLCLARPQALRALARAGTGLLGRGLPSMAQRIELEIDKALASLRFMSEARLLPRLLMLSVLAWLAEGLVFWSAACALASVVAPAGAWAALPVATLATLIPSTPGYLGTFDYFAARTMVEFGNPQAAATAFAILVHLLLWLPPTVLGGLYWILRPLSPTTTKPGTPAAS